MNPLRTLENAIAGFVEGAFGRVFRTEVRPMELAHKLAREMDENRTASVSKVYVPNEYSVWLSPRDRARYEGVEHEVIDELCAYLLEHARAEGFALASAPQIAFHTDEDLQLGEFGIEARMAKVEERRERASDAGRAADAPGLGASAAAGLRAPAFARPAAPAPAASGPPAPAAGAPVSAGEPDPEGAGNTMIVSTSQRTREAFERAGSRRRAKALLVVAGRRLVVPPRGATIGRSRDCDIVLEDSGVSRRHAELRPRSAASWTIEDLGSTNGLRVNGKRVSGAHELHSGDSIGVGSTEMVFEIST